MITQYINISLYSCGSQKLYQFEYFTKSVYKIKKFQFFYYRTIFNIIIYMLESFFIINMHILSNCAAPVPSLKMSLPP